MARMTFHWLAAALLLTACHRPISKDKASLALEFSEHGHAKERFGFVPVLSPTQHMDEIIQDPASKKALLELLQDNKDPLVVAYAALCLYRMGVDDVRTECQTALKTFDTGVEIKDYELDKRSVIFQLKRLLELQK